MRLDLRPAGPPEPESAATLTTAATVRGWKQHLRTDDELLLQVAGEAKIATEDYILLQQRERFERAPADVYEGLSMSGRTKRTD